MKITSLLAAAGAMVALGDLRELEKQKVEAYVPDSNLARGLNRGGRLRGRVRDPVHRRKRQKLRSPAGRAI